MSLPVQRSQLQVRINQLIEDGYMSPIVVKVGGKLTSYLKLTDKGWAVLLAADRPVKVQTRKPPKEQPHA